MMFAESWPDQAEHSQLLQSLCAAVRNLGARGWTPVRSGNFSVRLTPEQIAISASACDKVNLQVADLMLVDQSGDAADSARTPSAECLLHVHLYRRFAHVGCVLHTHSMTQTLASLRYAQAGALALNG